MAAIEEDIEENKRKGSLWFHEMMFYKKSMVLCKETYVKYLYYEKLAEFRNNGITITFYGTAELSGDCDLVELAVLAVCDNAIEFLTETLLPNYMQFFTNGELIDILLECSRDNQHHEITVMLLNYKYEHNLFSKPKLELL